MGSAISKSPVREPRERCHSIHSLYDEPGTEGAWRTSNGRVTLRKFIAILENGPTNGYDEILDPLWTREKVLYYLNVLMGMDRNKYNYGAVMQAHDISSNDLADSIVNHVLIYRNVRLIISTHTVDFWRVRHPPNFVLSANGEVVSHNGDKGEGGGGGGDLPLSNYDALLVQDLYRGAQAHLQFFHAYEPIKDSDIERALSLLRSGALEPYLIGKVWPVKFQVTNFDYELDVLIRCGRRMGLSYNELESLAEQLAGHYVSRRCAAGAQDLKPLFHQIWSGVVGRRPVYDVMYFAT